MERPYMICHILSALDGKITGAFMGTKAAQTVSEEYARIRLEYQADAWLYGTVTTKEFTQGRKPELDLVAKVPDGDFVAENNAALYYVSVDTQGEIGWESGRPCDRSIDRAYRSSLQGLSSQTWNVLYFSWI